MMLFPLPSSTFTNAANAGATSAAIKCLLPYTDGLEDSQIDVENVDGVVMLTGMAASEEAARSAASIAADFTSKQVICSLHVVTGVQPE